MVELAEDYKRVCTEAGKFATMWALQAIGLAPPTSDANAEYLLTDKQAQIPEELDFSKGKYAYHLQNVAKQRSQLPDDAFALIDKRVSGEKDVLARAYYAFTAAGLTEPEEIQQLLKEFQEEGLCDKKGKLKPKMLPFVSVAQAILADVITYYENNALDKKPENDEGKIDYRALYLKMHGLLLEGLRILSVKTGSFMSKNADIGSKHYAYHRVSVKPHSFMSRNAVFVSKNYAYQRASDLTGNQQLVTERNLGTFLNEDGSIKDPRALVHEMDARLERFDTIGYCFGLGYEAFIFNNHLEKGNKFPIDVEDYFEAASLMNDLGRLFGKWHQVINDAGEFSKNFSKSGSARGRDINNGQPIFTLVDLLMRGSAAERNYLKSFIGSNEPLADKDFKTIQAMIRKYDTYDQFESLRRHFDDAVSEKLERLQETGLFPDKILNKIAEFQKEIFDPTKKKVDRIMEERLFFKDKKLRMRMQVSGLLPIQPIKVMPILLIQEMRDRLSTLPLDASEIKNFFVPRYQELAKDYATCFVNTLPFQEAEIQERPYQRCIEYFDELFPKATILIPGANKAFSNGLFNAVRIGFFGEVQKAIDDGNIEPPKSLEERDAMNQIKELSNARIGPGSGKRHKG